MKRVEVKYKKTDSYLLFVKMVKEHANLGLREAKDFCDRCKEFPDVLFPLFVSDDLKFKIDIEHNFGDNIKILTKEYQRDIKLMKLGLGDYNDMIDILSSELSYKLSMSKNSKSSIKDMLLDMELDEETLTKFFNKIIK